MGFKKLVRSGMRFSAFTTASHNAAHGRDSRARVTRTSGRSLVHLLAACLAAFAVQHAASAQILPAGPISGTIVWNDTANWAGGVITNTTTGTYSGNAAFQFSAPYTVTSGSIYLSSVTNQAIRVNSFASSTGTQTITFNANTGVFLGQNVWGNGSSWSSNLILSLSSGTVTFNFPSVRNSVLNSQLTGNGTLRIIGDITDTNGTSNVEITNTTNNWTGDLINDGSLRFSSSSALPTGVGFGSFINNQRLLVSNVAGTKFFQRVNNLSGSATGNISQGNNTSVSSTIAVMSLISSTYAGGITNSFLDRNRGAMSLVKEGSATLTLTGTTNWYNGYTDVQSGTLDITSIRDAGLTLGASTYTVSGTTVTPVSMAGIQVGMRIFYNDGSSDGTVRLVNGTTGSNFTVSSALAGGGARELRMGFGSPLGMSSSSGTNLVFSGGQLRYSGDSSGSTNRLFSVGTGGGGIVADGTTGVLTFTGGGTMGFNGQTGARVFTLSGTNTGTNTLTTALADNGGQTALVKAGLGRWVLGGSHAYTGTTQIEAGRLTIGAGASIGSSRTVVVGTAAGSGARLDVTDTAYTFTGSQTLMGSGTVAGGGGGLTTVTINGKLSPGNGTGLLTFADTSVALGSTGNVIMEITGSARGTQYDAIDITGGANGGGLTYGGTMTLNFTQTLTSGTFNLFKYELNETSGTFGSIVFDPASQYQGLWALVGDVWQVTSGTTVMEFRNNVVEGGFSYGQLVIVPEPLTLGLLGIGGGIAVVGLRHLRRRKANGANGTSTSDSAADAA